VASEAGDGPAGTRYSGGVYKLLRRDEARSPALKQLYAYWESKRAGRTLPLKSAIDPAEIKDILPYVIISEVFDGPLRVRYRLVGTEIVKLRGREFTGKWLHELQWNPVFLERLLGEYRMLIDERRPLLGTDGLYSADGPRAAYEWGMFPLSDDGERMTHCLAIEDHRELERSALLHRSDWVHSSMPGGAKPSGRG
jgi:hypothetical protein